MSTRVAQPPHEALGLTPDDLLSMYRTWSPPGSSTRRPCVRTGMGRAPFVVPAEGHEACQVGTAWPMRRGVDVWLPYYRDTAIVLAAGMTPYEVFLGIFAKADDPSSGGRQMPSHWGYKRLGIISELLPDRDPGPPRRRHRLRREVPRRGRRRGVLVRGGRHERGRLARGPELRGDPQASRRVRLREQPLRDQRPPVQADGRGERRLDGPRGTASPASSSTGTTCSPATAR